MTTRTASPSPSSLMAQLGASGGAVAGWGGLMWIMRLMMSLRITVKAATPWEAFSGMLGAMIAGGLLPHRMRVQEAIYRRGLSELGYIRISIMDERGEVEISSLTIWIDFYLGADFLPPARGSPMQRRQLVGKPLAQTARSFEKLVVGFMQSHVNFVTLS